MAEEKSSIKGFLLGILAGGIIGSLITLLYAPTSGKEMRRNLSTKKDDILKDAEKYINETKEKANSLIIEGRNKAENLIKDTRKKADDILKGAGTYYMQGKAKLNEEKEKLKDAVKAGVNAYSEERKVQKSEE